MIVVIILAYCIILGVFSVCPFLVQVVGFIINAMVPDPIPFLDEFIMIFCMGSKLSKIVDFLDDPWGYIKEHIVSIIISILVIVVVGIVIYKYMF
jgi:hypothetical protein